MSIRLFPHANRNQNKVALTFDDGPTPGITDQVISILDSHGVRGTFFMVGKWIDAPGGREVVERALSSKHIVGNHTYHHYRPAIQADYPTTEFAQVETIIAKISGAPTRFARAPYVDYSASVCSLLESWLQEDVQRKIIDADRWGFDWDGRDSDAIVHTVFDDPVATAYSSSVLANGAIICLHDGSENDSERFERPTATIAALPKIIDGLRSKGYALVGLDELEFGDEDAVELSC